MGLDEIWQEAARNTRLIRTRLAKLDASSAHELPYIFVADSAVNPGDSIVRTGKVAVEKPFIYLSDGSPQLRGFDFEKDLSINTGTVTTFLLLRGISFPSYKYTHSSSLEVLSGPVERTIDHFSNLLARQENTDTALIAGMADSWQISLLIYVAELSLKSAPDNFSRLLGRLGRRAS